MNTTAIVEDRQRATWKKAQDDNKAALVKSFLAGDIDHFITNLDEGTTLSAVTEVYVGLTLMVWRNSKSWGVSLHKGDDQECEYACGTFNTIAEAAEWGADALESLTEEVDEAIQDALRVRMKELRGMGPDTNINSYR